MKLLLLFLFFLAALLADYVVVAVGYLQSLQGISYQYRKYIDVAMMVPWSAIVFGLAFGLLGYLYNKNRVENIFGGDFIGFVFLCPLVSVILDYAGVFAFPVLITFSINPVLVFYFIKAFLIAFFAEKGLMLNLKFHGLLTVGAVGALVFILDPYIRKLIPINLSFYWYTIIGTTIAAFALFQEGNVEDNIDRESLATINKLRKLY